MSNPSEGPPVVEDSSRSKEGAGIGNIVASHYNQLEEKGLESRKESRIYYMRNLNNWIKSQLIQQYVQKVRERKPQGEPLNILDIGCGKGGDLLKWSKARVDHVVCCDIAETSVEQCRERYNDMRRRNRGQNLFSAEFFAADCTKTKIRNLFKDPNIQFDIVSIQFAFHYCFESLQQAEIMLENITTNMRKGGFFIGTTPDAFDIVSRLVNSHSNTVGNSVYSITLEDESLLENPSSIPLFGTKYNFHLEGVVDCPEFLVHFPTLNKLAERYGLMMIAKRRFNNYFNEFKDSGKELMVRMNALETYPPFPGCHLVGRDNEDLNYGHVKQLLDQDPNIKKIGTISKEEWEAASLYIIFAFKKLS